MLPRVPEEQGLRDRVLVLRETENIRMSQDAERPRHVTVEGFEDDRQQKGGARESSSANVTSAASSVWASVPEKRARSQQARSLAETRHVDMVSVDLNALEIGAVLLHERNREIQSGIESCAAVTVFAAK